MITKKYKIAEHVIEVTSIHQTVHDYCQEYETDEAAEFAVATTQEDIDLEKKKTDSEYAYEGKPLPHFSQAMIESTAIYRKIADGMIDYDTVVFHGSVIAVDGEAYLFTAKSGTGKSTHAALWREVFGDRAVMVNDDKPMIKITDEGVTVYGTPYNGKHGLGSNIAVPLKAICILVRGEENKIEKITRQEAYPMLLQQVYRPADTVKMQKTLELMDKMGSVISLYRLHCNMDIEAAKVSYEGMSGKVLE